jgi:pre-60S factor REI1
LPPISRDAFENKVNIKETKSESESNGSEDEEDDTQTAEDEETVSPHDCLFCGQSFTHDDAGFDSNLEHMRAIHGLHIPDSEQVEDVQSLIGYLSTEVRVWHECLYCGATKPSTQAVQDHMRDKGHCQINLDREPELYDFWERPESSDDDDKGAAKQPDLSDVEMRFASGKIVTSRRAGPSKKAKQPRNTMQLATTTSPQAAEDGETPPTAVPQPSSSRQVARREEMGLIGVLPQQRQALVLAEQKARRSEQQAARTREWMRARGANTQEFDQLNNRGKWGKQNHKLLPR